MVAVINIRSTTNRVGAFFLKRKAMNETVVNACPLKANLM